MESAGTRASPRARMPRIVGLAWMAITLVAGAWGYAIGGSSDGYWERRASILLEEESAMIGGDLVFEEKERLVNQMLMKAKHKEIDDAFIHKATFLPSQSFLLVSDKIRESPVFKIIEQMPKGAVLHTHDTAIGSSDYLFSNVTFRPNLYMCDLNGQLWFQFFDKPDRKDCNWQLLSELRKKDTNNLIDQRISRQLTMVTEQPEKTYPDSTIAWTKFIDIFRLITPMLTYRPVYEDYFYHGLLDLYNDNVFYIELRSTLPTLYELDGTKYGPIEVALIYKKVTERFMQDYPHFLGMKLIYAPIRSMETAQFNESLKVALELKRTMPNFFAGFDLVGFEEQGPPLINFADQIRTLDDGIFRFFHAGETDWYGTNTDENLVDALMLNTKRIGHGYAILKHPELLKYARNKKVAIEISPISNQVLVLVKDLRNHPASVLFAENYPVIISNDDPGLWGSRGLSYDFYEAFVGMMSRNADLRALKQLAMNSILYSAMSDKEKNRAMEIWKNRWDEFIEKMNDDVLCKYSRL
ncbi:PREDICTED: adenosine deaminase CECR1-like [Ceratosolen solmsi marchali]|uniref:Adenosine deaminase n=1 Tax=Ceratosolen solmsi marchali TaxID=326594 RepID=A0AAJ6YCU9_9HYME|nr:PREDICTED: adenosine deaminase CECR1-like [Ceratosolen solmsi marchali]